MSLRINKNGIISASNIIESDIFGKSLSIGKQLNENLYDNNIEIYTNSNGTISSKTGQINLTASWIQAHAGQTLIVSYDVCTEGARYSTEQGQTSWQQTRYGIHGGMSGINASGTSQTLYPFADYLNYSGSATRVIMSWTIPTGWQSYGNVGFSIQNFDKPASTNNAVWFIKNVKIELSTYPTPYINYLNTVNGDGYIHSNEIIEV